MNDLRLLGASGIETHLPALVAVLRATVAGGASIGFLHPVSGEDAAAYWRGVQEGVARRERILAGAFDGAGRLVGSGQLALEPRANGRHRAEVQKVMVAPEARGKGTGRALMEGLEREAHRAGRTLLLLDTREGDAAEHLYRRLGWQEAGRIPGYTRDEDGSPRATIYFYRTLEGPDTPPAGLISPTSQERPMEDSVQRSLTVPAAPEHAFHVFTEDLARWWPAEYTWAGDTLEWIGMEPRVGGACSERGPEGFRCDWGRVLRWEPPNCVVFTWQIGPARVPEPNPDRASEVEVRFVPAEPGRTRVELVHRHFLRHGEGAGGYRDAMASPQGWSYILERYARAVA